MPHACEFTPSAHLSLLVRALASSPIDNAVHDDSARLDERTSAEVLELLDAADLVRGSTARDLSGRRR